MLTADREIVEALGRAIAEHIGESRFNLWFRDRTRFSWEGDLLTIGVPNRFYQEWLQKTFSKDVKDVASALLATEMQVRFVIDPELFRYARAAESADHANQSPPQENGLVELPTQKIGQSVPVYKTESTNDRQPFSSHVKRTRRWKKLRDFVVGPCNRVAHASALAVVEHPGLEVNPLVLHGPVGIGKTHLLEGIYVALREQHNDCRVIYATAEDFTNRFVQSMRLGKLHAFRKTFRDCDALLLDDLQFLGSKTATQEEFLHTLDALSAGGRQVVATCDCHPRLNEQFMPELVDRLQGGAVWGVMPPDFDTRLNLLRAKSSRKGGSPLSEETLNFLADQLRGNIRELEGAINGVFHLSKVTGRRIDVGLIREAIGDLLRHSIRIIRVPEIDRAVCAVLRLDNGALQNKNKSWAYSHPRMIAIYLAKKHTTASYSDIGRHFGNRSHSTVVAAERKVRKWLKDDGTLSLGKRNVRVRDLIEQIERELLS